MECILAKVGFELVDEDLAEKLWISGVPWKYLSTDLAYGQNDNEVEFERVGEELHIRPLRTSFAGVLPSWGKVEATKSRRNGMRCDGALHARYQHCMYLVKSQPPEGWAHKTRCMHIDRYGASFRRQGMPLIQSKLL
jgi:hypothetical protein